MPHRYAEIAFTDRVKNFQEEAGSRDGYARMESRLGEHNRTLTERERDFLALRDSFYLASVGETGWPYVQHRGGDAGFVHILDDETLAFADFRGNKQYVTRGNVSHDDRVALFFMDYVNRRRLKIYGRMRPIAPNDPRLEPLLGPTAQGGEGERRRVERGFVIQIEAYDWNCPQYITERFTAKDVEKAVAPLHARIAELEAQLENASR